MVILLVRKQVNISYSFSFGIDLDDTYYNDIAYKIFRGTGSPWFYLGIYIAMNALICILSLAKELVGRFVPLKASKVKVLKTLLHLYD